MLYRTIKLLAVVGFSFLLTGCLVKSYAHTDSDLEYKVSRIHHGTIATQGVRLEAIDGTFELTSDESWTPPHHLGENCLVNPTADNYGNALAKGAEAVKIYHPAHPEPLYGVIALCGRVDGSTGPAARSYQLVIPTSYVHQTTDGRVSVVYEYHQYDPNTEADNGYAKAQAKSWILWISRIPLQKESGMGGGKTIGELVRPLF